MNRTIFTSIDQCRENHENWDVELTSVFCKLKVKKFLVKRESPNPSITLDQAVETALTKTRATKEEDLYCRRTSG